jgi:hypothetical protein
MAFIFIILFIFGILVEKMNQRRNADPNYDAKITRIINKTDPFYKFVFNAFGWVLAILFFYYIYLGWEGL